MCGDGKNIPGAGVTAVAVGHPADGAAETAAITGGNATIGHGRATGQPAGGIERRTRWTAQHPHQQPMADMLPLGIGRARS